MSVAAATVLLLALLQPGAAPEAAPPAGREVSLAEIEGLLRANRFVEAEPILQQAVRQHPDNARMHYLLGFALVGLQRHAEAAGSLRRAVELEPGEPSWWHALAKALREQDDDHGAIEALERALALGEDADLHFALGACRQNVGERDAAERSFRAALALDPSHAQAALHLAKMQAYRGHADEAVALYRQALESDPELFEARFGLGVQLASAGRHEEAVEAFQAVIKRRPAHAEALYKLSQSLLRLGRREEAMQVLERYRSANRIAKSIEFAEASVELHPEDAQMRRDLTGLLLEAGRTEDALLQLQVLQVMEPLRADTLRLGARAFEQLGRTEEARGALALAERLEAGEPAP